MYSVCNSKKILAFWNVLFIIKFGVSYGIEEKCQYCNKNFLKSLGRHVWRCTAKLDTQSSQITGNHGDQNNEQIQFIENSSRSLVNLNDQHSLNAPEGTITEYDKKKCNLNRTMKTVILNVIVGNHVKVSVV